ncbi:MAG: hypothetical protein ABW321_13070, partial [Polyangiales bacterium]
MAWAVAACSSDDPKTTPVAVSEKPPESGAGAAPAPSGGGSATGAPSAPTNTGTPSTGGTSSSAGSGGSAAPDAPAPSGGAGGAAQPSPSGEPSQPMAADENSWLRMGYDHTNTYFNPVETAISVSTAPQLKEVWRVEVGGYPPGSPTVA